MPKSGKVDTMQPKAARTTGFIVRATKDAIGKKVVNFAGEDLGKIEDIMIDFGVARVTYAILSFGGFLGVGNKLFAVPWLNLKYDVATENFVIRADKRLLEKAPGFDKDNWPDMSDPARLSEIYKYYGESPYWE
jgi:sporulation protein YlmC with PRC-barrel domain